MVSAFELAAKNVVRELSKEGELIPVDSLKSSTHFSPYYLVRKKIKSSWYWRSPYVWLNLSLKDILEPSSPEPDVIQNGPFHFNDEVDGRLTASVEVAATVQGKISGETAVSNSTSLEVKTLTVSPNTWESLQKERKVKSPEPRIFQELQTREEDLYVVTEAVKIQKETILKKSRNRKGLGMISIPGASCFQGETEGHLNTVKTVTIPEGSILAFQVAKLIIRDDWKVLLIPDKNERSFLPKKRKSDDNFSAELPPSGIRYHFSGSLHYKTSCGGKMAPSGIYFEDFSKLEVDSDTDFEKLEAEVDNEKNILTRMSKKFKQYLFQNFVGLLQNKQALLDLEDMLEESLYTGIPPKKVEGVPDNFLSNLQNSTGQLQEDLAGAVLYLLDALNALSDVQHKLLFHFLEKKTLSQHVKLVKEILKRNFNETEETIFSLPSELLSFDQGQDEESTHTHILLEECGLGFSEDESHFIWNPNTQHYLCALYGSLVILETLSKAH